LKGEPVFKIFTDENGRFDGQAELPTSAEKVYVYTSAFGVQQLAELEVKDGKVSAYLGQRPDQQAPAMRRAAAEHQVWSLGKVGNYDPLYSIVSWEGNKYGKITNDNGLLSLGALDANALKAISNYVGPHNGSKLSGLESPTEQVNTSIVESFVNKEGQTVLTESAQVYVTYIGEAGAWYQDGLGYYYYKTGEAPATAADALKLKHYIILPNMSLPGDMPFTNGSIGGNPYNYGIENAPAYVNMRVQLLYEDEETGEVSTHFPPGYTIGYFLIAKANYKQNTNLTDTYQFNNIQVWYSNQEWNSDKKSHFVAMQYKDKIVYGVEDGANRSFNDLLFTVEADPTGTILSADREEIPAEEEEYEETTQTTYYTYAYEDVWPTGYDYDLNDVIVEHKQEVTFDSYNYVSKVVDTFKAVQPAGSADYTDAFAIQIPQSLRGTITLPEGATDEGESIILFRSAKDVKDREFVVTRTFTGKQVSKVAIDADDYNPYVIANFKGEASNRTEVHLPKHAATSKANADQIGSKDDAYFVDKAGVYPFALKLPLGGSNPFIPVTEQVSIDKEYNYYKAWVESKMTGFGGWYQWYTKSN
jgi:hypothetical protein